MRAMGVLCLALVLIVALVLPSAVYAAKSHVEPGATNVEIVKKIGVKGVPLMGPPSSGPKLHATMGIVGEPLPQGGKRHAIVVGISNYPGPYTILKGGYDLFYADDDAIVVDGMLEGYGFDIQLLTASEDNQQSKVTRQDVLGAITNLAPNVTKDDEVVFYFSGHGAKCVPNLTPSQGGGKVGIATWGGEDPEPYLEVIWDKELKEAFKGFKTDRIIFIFDTCLAGGMIDLGDKGRVICMATTQNGVAAEYGEAYGQTEEPFINHGLFTYFFVELGMVHGLADFYPAAGYVTLEEAFDLARFTLEGMSIITPELWQIPTIKDGFGGDLLL